MIEWISKRNKNQGPLSSCLWLRWEDFVCVLPLYQPMQAELCGPFGDKQGLLMQVTLVLL